MTQLIRDIQEKYNQFVIFYRTGKLAYVSKRIWDQYDNQYAIQKRIDEFKRLAMTRATDFNTAFKEYNVYDQLSDAWKVVVSVPNNAMQLDEQYGVTSWLTNVGKGVASSVTSSLSSFINQWNVENQPNNQRRRQNGPINWFPFFSNQNDNRQSKSSNLFGFLTTKRKREKKKINPWGSPFNPYKHNGYKSFTKRKNTNNKANPWDDLVNFFSPREKKRNQENRFLFF